MTLSTQVTPSVLPQLTEGLVRQFQTSGIQSVSLEAGHLYADDSLDDSKTRTVCSMQFAIGKQLYDALTQQGISVQTVVFIDDYNAEESLLDVDAYTHFAGECDFAPDNVLYESDFVDPALALCHELESSGDAIWKPRDSYKQLLLKKNHKSLGRVELARSPNTGNTKLSCTSLDTALTMQKWKQADAAVTILPTGDNHHHYLKQQKRVHHVLQQLAVEPQKQLLSVIAGEDSCETFPPLS